MFGAIVSSFVGIESAPEGVTKPGFSTIETLAVVAWIPVRTTQPALLVVPSTVLYEPASLGMNSARAVTPSTPVPSPLRTSTSIDEPTGGEMRLTCLTSGRPEETCCAQLTRELTRMLAPVWAVDSVALQPVVLPEALTGLAS